MLAILFSVLTEYAKAQDKIDITLPEALDTGIKNYPSIRAKINYVQTAHALTLNARNEYLPNVIGSIQQNYGTVNGQFGPAAPVGVLSVSSAGPPAGQQNWNAAFGGLYIVSTTWEAFTFGRIRSRVQLASSQERQNATDLEQEQFIQRIKISSAYLNLIIARHLVESGKSNLLRAEAVRQAVKARTLSGLNPGVDSTLANAEVSKAKLLLLDFLTNEKTVQRQLAESIGLSIPWDFQPDTVSFANVPEIVNVTSGVAQNPQLLFYKARVDYASQLITTTKKSLMPGVTLFGMYQGRGSGFSSTYNPENLTGYNNGYQNGIDPTRFNYIAGVSFTWNLMSPFKVRQQVVSQRFNTAGYQAEYDQLKNQLQNQLILSDQKIENTLLSAHEAPVQYRAASEAYLQKNILYKNGLATMVDLQQAMYVLNRAEIDRSVAYINVWLALLGKAAALGDFNLFINQMK
jgi:outer membrane protein TolC